ncbi:hypothetical protein BC940DRAFT_367369 [Gongronella butleri]|nr:hypothetical protein BC940DRAFT_367369 [Gongronella butleri]
MDQAEPMKWWFHNEVSGVHLLFPSFVLDSGEHIFAAYMFICIICWAERALTYCLDGPLGYQSRYRIRWSLVIARTAVYGLATVLRLWYMLITMYFNIGLFSAVVLALTTGQLVLEILKSRSTRHDEYRRARLVNEFADDDVTAMLDREDKLHAGHHPPTTRA